MKNCKIQISLKGKNTPKKLNEFKEWLEQKNFTNETIKNYLATINQYGTSKIDTNLIVNFLRKHLKRYEPATLRSKRNALASYAKFQKIHATVEWESISKLIPSVQRKFFPTVTDEELILLKQTNTRTDSKTNERNFLILDFLFYTGLRISELINLRNSDYVNGLLKILGKGNKVRYVLLPEFLTKYLDPYSKNYLFLTRNGKKLTKGQIRRNIKRKCRQAGIRKNISPHSFRRSLATNLYNSGGKLATIQKQLGHASLDTTLGYIHNDYQTLYADYSKLWQEKSA